MTRPRRPGIENLIQGDYGEQWLEVVASAHGILHGRPSTLDLEKADVELTLRGTFNGTYCPSVKAQVKTTIDAKINEAGDMVYDLDAHTHNVLCRSDHGTGRVLVVLQLSEDGDRVRLLDDGTLLVGKAGWVCLMGRSPTPNEATCAVTLPSSNTIDQEGLTRMVSTHGVRRTTVVPEFNPWEEATP